MRRALALIFLLALAPSLAAAALYVDGGRESFPLPATARKIDEQCAELRQNGRLHTIVRLVSAGYRETELTGAAFQRSIEQSVLGPAGWETYAGDQISLFGLSATRRSLRHKGHQRVMATLAFTAEDCAQLVILESISEAFLESSTQALLASARLDSERSSRRSQLKAQLAGSQPELVVLGLGKTQVVLMLLVAESPLPFRAGEIVFRSHGRNDETVTVLALESAFSLSIGANGVTIPASATRLAATFQGRVLCEAPIVRPPGDEKE